MESTLIIGGHGLGDCILSLQCARFVKYGMRPDIKISTRTEVFNALHYVFDDFYKFEQIDEKYAENNAILSNPELLKEISEGYDNVYYVIPDLLFSNPLAFDFVKNECHPQIVKSRRLLTNNAFFKKQIYLGLMTATPINLYSEIPKLAVGLAEALPDYEVVLPLVSVWDGKGVSKIEINNAPSNLKIFQDIPFNDALGMLRKSCYFVGTDNGPSHVAYHYGIPRLILDAQYGYIPFIARWREDVSDSIPINLKPSAIIDTVKTNLQNPVTTLIPRGYVASFPSTDWKKQLIIKH